MIVLPTDIRQATHQLEYFKVNIAWLILEQLQMVEVSMKMLDLIGENCECGVELNELKKEIKISNKNI